MCYIVPKRVKMSFTGMEKRFCVLEFDKNNSWTCVQRKFRTEFSKQPLDRRTIQKWHAKFKEEGYLCFRKRIAPSPSTEMIEKVRNIFQRSPRKSIKRANLELQMPSTTVWRVVRKHLHMIPYKLHLFQHLKYTDKSAREYFCASMQVMLEEDGFDDRLMFSDEATFHVTGKVNEHNPRMWETEHPHAIQEHVRDSSQVNVFCAISKKCVYGPFIFEGTTVNSEGHLAMVQNWLMELLFE